MTNLHRRMTTLHRRGLLRALGATATVSALAGCLEDSSGGDDTGGDERVRGDAVVDYPGMVDGEAAVGADERTIEYEDPEETFELGAGYKGEEADGSNLRLSRDLSGDTIAAFVAPAYVDADERFEYHVFANEAFVEFAEWHVVGISGGSLEDVGDGSFEHLQESVHGFVVTPGDVDGLAVVDKSADSVNANGEGDLTGVAINRKMRNPHSTSPNVAFAFKYDADAERLVVTHEGGDSVSAEQIRFDADREMTVREDFEGTVSAGDTATLSVPPTARVRIVWESADGDQTVTVASWRGPDA